MKNKQNMILVISLLLLLLLILNTLTGCSQSMTKSMGGTTTVELEINQKLEMITWKDSDLWYLTKPMTDDDVAETHTFKQQTDLGVLEGTVIVIEKKE